MWGGYANCQTSETYIKMERGSSENVPAKMTAPLSIIFRTLIDEILLIPEDHQTSPCDLKEIIIRDPGIGICNNKEGFTVPPRLIGLVHCYPTG